MAFPFVLVIVSGAICAFALLAPEAPEWATLAFPVFVAALFLLGRAIVRARAARKAWILVDGSNVMHWQDNTPNLVTVRAVVDRIKAAGFAPHVVFDANAGYLLSGRYRNEVSLARDIGLLPRFVTVVPKGMQADPLLLDTARFRRAKIVTNDRFRDWADRYPEVANPGHLLRGTMRGGELALDLPRTAAGQKAA